jgi:hypothetical protein
MSQYCNGNKRKRFCLVLIILMPILVSCSTAIVHFNKERWKEGALRLPSKSLCKMQTGDYGLILPLFTPRAVQGRKNVALEILRERGHNCSRLKTDTVAAKPIEQRQRIQASRLVEEERKLKEKLLSLSGKDICEYAISSSGYYWSYEPYGKPYVEEAKQREHTIDQCHELSPTLAAAEEERQRQKEAIRQERAAALKTETEREVARRAEVKRQEKAELEAKIAPFRQSCSAFGFNEASQEMSTCLFELYKLDQQAKQTRADLSERKPQMEVSNNQANVNAAAQQQLMKAQSRLAEQQVEEQRFQQGMQLLQNSQQILNSMQPDRRTTCRFNPILNSMTCQ